MGHSYAVNKPCMEEIATYVCINKLIYIVHRNTVLLKCNVTLASTQLACRVLKHASKPYVYASYSILLVTVLLDTRPYHVLVSPVSELVACLLDTSLFVHETRVIVFARISKCQD